MLTYGDGVTDLDLSALLRFHKSHGKLATVTTVRSPARFGRIGFVGDQITEFYEKPETAKDGSRRLFCLNRKALDYIEGDETVLEHEPVDRLAKDGQFMGYRHHGFGPAWTR